MLLFIVAPFLALGFDIFGLCYPIEVAPQILLNHLLFAKLVEVTACFGFFRVLFIVFKGEVNIKYNYA